MPATDTRIEKHYAAEVGSTPGYRKLDPKKFIPADETVLVRRHDKVTQTEGGITLPDRWQEESVTGDVVAVSEGETFLAVDDVVLMDKTAADNPAARPFESDKQLIVLHCYRGRESDILGKFAK